MDATYTIQFKGFHEKAAAALEKMLRDDIAAYPKRLRMESASVVDAEAAEATKSVSKQAARIVDKILKPKPKVKRNA